MPFVKSVTHTREIGERYGQKLTSEYEPDKFYTKEELQKLYVKLAKRADQRIVRLKALSHEQGFENVLQYAYKTAMHDLKQSGITPDRKGLMLFNKKELYEGKKDKNGELEEINMHTLNRNINNVIRFLDSPTSTRQGIEKVYQKRAESFFGWTGKDMSSEELNKLKKEDKQKYKEIMGTRPTWQQLADYFSNGNAQKIDNAMGYKDFFQALVYMKKNPKDIKNPIIRRNVTIIQNDAQIKKIADKLTRGAKNDTKTSTRTKKKTNRKKKVRKSTRK